MGIIVKQSIKGTIYVYIGVVLGFITTGVLFPRIYSTEEIGLLKLLVAFSTLFAQFGNLGITGATIILFPHFREKEKSHHGFLAFILIIGLVGFILISFIQYLLSPIMIENNLEKSRLFADNLNLLYILVFFQVFFSILDTYYSSLFNSVYGTFLKDILQRILIIFSIFLFFFDFISFNVFVIAYVISICIPTFFLIFRLIKERQFSLKTEWSYFDRRILKSIVSISIFSILNSFSLVIIQNVDIMMINGMIGISHAGIYSICFFFGLFVSMPSRSINRIANIVAAESWRKNDLDTISELYKKSCQTLFIIGLLLFLGIWVNIENILKLIGDEYRSGKWVIFFIGLGSLVEMTTGANTSILSTSKYYRVQTVFIVVLMALLILTNLILIPKFGIVGASIGSVISITALSVTRYYYVFYKFGLQPYNIKYIWVLFIGILSFFITRTIPVFSHYLIDIALRGFVLFVLYFTPIYFLKISDDINNKTVEYLKRLNNIISKQKNE